MAIEQLMSGTADSQRVEISGIIRAFRLRENITIFELVSGGYRLDVHVPKLAMADPQPLIGALVRVRGTAATFFSGRLRHLITVSLHVPGPEDFVVERTPTGDPFDAPVTLLNSLAQYHPDFDLGQRVHVRGRVIHQRRGEDLFLQDATGGMRVRTRQLDRVSPGEVVEAVGFVDFEQFLPVLQDAVFRRTDEPAVKIAPKTVTEAELKAGLHHGDFVTLRGKLLDRSMTWRQDRVGMPAYLRTVLMLQGADLLFSAESDTDVREPAALAQVPLGSTVEVSGVCVLDTDQEGKLMALQILLPHGNDLRVLERPSWWTPRRLLGGLATLFGVLVMAAAWTVVISRKNSALRVLVGEKEEAQIELQHANDRLEERVKERSAQLKSISRPFSANSGWPIVRKPSQPRCSAVSFI